MAIGAHDRWLSASNEVLFNNGIQHRMPRDVTPFNMFLAVLRRSHPLVPVEFDGPIDSFVSRVTTLWDTKANHETFLYEQKRTLVLAMADYISRLAIFSPLEMDTHQKQSLGIAFFQRPSQPVPFELPIMNSKRTLRPEATEAFYILTVLLRSAGISSSPPESPEGNVPYLPYYACKTDAERTAMPRRTRVAEFARTAMFFRQAASLPPEKHALSLHTFSPETINPPCPENIRPLTMDYYQWGAGVEGTFEARERTPLASGIMYFVAKLMEIRDFKAKQEKDALHMFNHNLQAIPGTRTTLASNISLLLLFLKNELKAYEHPHVGTLLNFACYGCIPLYVNGILDKGVSQFEAAFMDAIVEMVFVTEGKSVAETPQHPLPPPDRDPHSCPTTVTPTPSPVANVDNENDSELVLYDPMLVDDPLPTISCAGQLPSTWATTFPALENPLPASTNPTIQPTSQPGPSAAVQPTLAHAVTPHSQSELSSSLSPPPSEIGPARKQPTVENRMQSKVTSKRDVHKSPQKGKDRLSEYDSDKVESEDEIHVTQTRQSKRIQASGNSQKKPDPQALKDSKMTSKKRKSAMDIPPKRRQPKHKEDPALEDISSQLEAAGAVSTVSGIKLGPQEQDSRPAAQLEAWRYVDCKLPVYEHGKQVVVDFQFPYRDNDILEDFNRLLSLSEKRQNEYLTVIPFKEFMGISEDTRLSLIRKLVLLDMESPNDSHQSSDSRESAPDTSAESIGNRIDGRTQPTPKGTESVVIASIPNYGPYTRNSIFEQDVHHAKGWLSGEWVDYGIIHCHYDWWMRDRTAASRNLVLKLASGPRNIITSWMAEEKDNSKSLALVQRYQALDQAFQQLDLSEMDSLICPIHLVNHFTLAVIVNPLASTCNPEEKDEETVLYYLDSMGERFDPSNAQDILVFLAEAGSYRKRCALGNTDTTTYRPPPGDDTLKAIKEAIRVVQVQVPLQQDSDTCGLRVILNAKAAMEIGPLNLSSTMHNAFSWDPDFRETVIGWVMSRVTNKSLASLNRFSHDVLRLSYAATHLESLGLDPNAVVECQDLEKGDSKDYERVSLSLAAIACEIANVKHTRCLNALSIPFNKASNRMPELALLSETVSDVHHAERFCASTKQDPLPHYQPTALFFAILSSCGTFHTPHVDPNGNGTVLFVKEGYKLVSCAFPEDGLTADILSSLQQFGLWSLFETAGLVFVFVVVGPHQALMMPPGVRHAVATVLRCDKPPSPAIVFGFMFYSRYCIEASLYTGIQFAIWWKDWSNATHDDFPITLARMLMWQCSFKRNLGPFRGRNLFALICMGKMGHMLQAEKSGQEWEKVTMREVKKLADALISQMDEEQRERYMAFQADTHSFYRKEWQSHREQQ